MKDQDSNENEVQNNGPHMVAIRNGKKGPGKVVVHVATKDDADIIAGELNETGDKSEGTYIVRPVQEVQILTLDEWRAENAKVEEAKALLASARSKLSPEERAACGMTS